MPMNSLRASVMDTEGPRRALLLGLVEVTQPVKDLEEQARARMFALCHTASTSGHVEDSGWLGWQERGLMGVEVVLHQQHLQVTCDDVLITRHNLAEVCAIMTVQGTDGHVVLIGRCLVKELRLAVVLDMMSELDAHRLEEDVLLRLSRLEPLSVQLAASQDTMCSGPLPRASSLTWPPDSTVLSHVSGSSAPQNTNETPACVSASRAGTRVRPHSDSARPPPVPSKPVLLRAPVSSTPPRAKPPLASMPATATLLNTPLLLLSRSPVSLVSTRLVTTQSVSPRPVITPSACIRPVTTPTVSSRRVITPPVSSRPTIAPPESPRPVTFPPVSTRPISTPPESTELMSTGVVSTPPVSTQSESTPPVSTQPVSTLLVSTSTVFTPSVSTPPASTRPVPFARVFTPLVSTLTSSGMSMPTASVFTSSVSTPSASTLPVAHTRVFTPLASITTVRAKTVSTPVSVMPVCTSSASTRPMFTRPVSKPRIFTRPVSLTSVFSSRVSTPTVSTTTVSTPTVSTPTVPTPMVSATPVSTPTVSATPVSTPTVSTPTVSNPTMSTAPVSTPPVSTPLASTPPVSIRSVPTVMVSSPPLVTALPESVPAVSTGSVQDTHRFSLASSSSQEEDESGVFHKIELILRTSKVDDSERLITPDLKPQKEDLSTSLKHMLCSFLENEHDYLSIIGRIRDTRKVVKAELQKLLRRSDRLVDFHENLYRDLYQEFPSCAGIARVFLSRKEELEQYRYYLMDAPQITCQLTEELTGEHPTLEADIKSSWKRLHFYFMTFEKLAKIVPVEEQPLVQEVVELLREMNRQSDSGILIDAITGAPFSLHTLGTPHLHGLFTIKDSSGGLSSRIKYHVLFFEEMMVITLPKKNKYQYKDHLPVRQLSLRQGRDEATFVLELVQGGDRRNRKYTFRPRQQEAKDAWVKEISRLRLEYTKKVMRQNKVRFGYQ